MITKKEKLIALATASQIMRYLAEEQNTEGGRKEYAKIARHLASMWKQEKKS